jgi:hypothetical protein
MDITYKINAPVSVDQYIDVLNRSTLGERRPVDDPERIHKMLYNSNLLISAWREEELIGVARSVTDFAYCCYLSDLAVNVAYQKLGVGKFLIEVTKQQISPQSLLLLLSAPAAMDYYPNIGFEKADNAFIIHRRI